MRLSFFFEKALVELIPMSEANRDIFNLQTCSA